MYVSKEYRKIRVTRNCGRCQRKELGIASNIRYDWVIICNRAINHDSNLCDSQKSTCGTRLAWLKTWLTKYKLKFPSTVSSIRRNVD